MQLTQTICTETGLRYCVVAAESSARHEELTCGCDINFFVVTCTYFTAFLNWGPACIWIFFHSSLSFVCTGKVTCYGTPHQTGCMGSVFSINVLEFHGAAASVC